MGAYLSEPVTDTVSSDECANGLSDAHTCILNYDENTSLFGVFDGHGGAEVAQYSAINLPKLLKTIPAYEEGNMSTALEEAFLKFDSTLVEPAVVNELKAIAGSIDDDEEEDDEEAEIEASILREEANIPIEDLIARYGNREEAKVCLPSHLKKEMIAKGEKPLSPYLRAKQNNGEQKNDNENEDVSVNDMCSSSTNKSSESCEPSCSSSFVSNGELVDVSDSKSNNNECESVSSSVEASNSNNLTENDSNNVSSSKMDDKCEDNITSNEKTQVESVSDSISSSSSFEKSSTNSSDVNKSEKDDESGVSTSTEVERNCEATAGDEDSREGDSSAPTSTEKSLSDSSSASKGKGKQRKVTPLKKVKFMPDELDSQPIYEAFLQDFDDSNDSSDESDDGTDDFRVNSPDSDSNEDADDDDDEEDEDSSDVDDEEDEIMYSKRSKIRLERSRLFLSSSGDYEEPGKESGCTAVVALLRGNQLYVANAGDSRCVLCRNGKAVDMSVDHKPEDELERQRIEKAGGEVTSDGRVNGGLNLSRAIGDHSYKDNPNLSLKEQMITAFPEVKSATILPGEDKFMVLACDGIWNSMTSQQVVDYINERIDKNEKLSSICEELFHHCLSSNTMGDGTGCDNMTCVIVKFDGLSKRKRTENDNNEAEEAELRENLQSKRQKVENEIESETNLVSN
ncbi:putative protein phosphatase-like protein [Dinothrombium tinctorium]|uniref:protein-serine/threonine phosphatase n=1 Tax=Dinothrombium tinctorium TaxID=1965070 RepID=A0A3S3P861_9ACAR|nr:putative protein phosphatase-like protein [Dinothrombium tinctorium]